MTISPGPEDAPAADNVVRLGGARLTISNAQEIGTREEQQDAFGVSDASDAAFVAHAGVAAIVADGMGGLVGGAQASRAAVQRFLEAYETKNPDEPVGEALMRATLDANEIVVELAKADDTLGNMGTTLVAAAVVEGALSWISVGDSRLYLLRDGELLRLTVDHNVATELEEEVAAGRMSPAEAQSDPDGPALTSFIGIERLELVDHNLRPLGLRDGDRLLLCSDGLDGPLSDDEIFVLGSGEPSFAAESLVARALSKEATHQDNLTGVLLTYASESGATESGASESAPSTQGSVPLDGGSSQPSDELIPSDEKNDHA